MSARMLWGGAKNASIASGRAHGSCVGQMCMCMPCGGAKTACMRRGETNFSRMPFGGAKSTRMQGGSAESCVPFVGARTTPMRRGGDNSLSMCNGPKCAVCPFLGQNRPGFPVVAQSPTACLVLHYNPPSCTLVENSLPACPMVGQSPLVWLVVRRSLPARPVAGKRPLAQPGMGMS